MKNTILFLLPLLAACSKGGRADSASDLGGAWRQTAESANGQNLWSTYYHEPCELDDRWEFLPDGTYAVADSGTTCSYPTARSGHWRIDGATLFLDSLTYDILECNSRELTLERERVQNGFHVRYRLGFTRP